jgi:hypothetical protein
MHSPAPRRTTPIVLVPLLVLGFVEGCRAQGTYYIPPGQETAVLQFLEPLRMGETVVAGYRLENVAIDHDLVRLELLNAQTGASARVELLHRWSPASDVEVRPAPGTPPEITGAIEQALTQHHSAASPWVRKKLSTGDFGPLLPLLSFFALLVTTCLLVQASWRTASSRRRETGALVAVTLLAFALRLTMSPRTFLHEYNHINESMILMFESSDATKYGWTGPALYRLADLLFGGQERTAFLVNAVAASLTIPAVVLFDLGLFQAWPRALLSGFIVALLPDHLRFAASEELWIVGIFFSFWSLGAWTVWLRTSGGWALATAVLALSLAMQSRSELLVLPLLHAGLLFALRAPRTWLRTLVSNPLIAGVLGLAALIGPRALAMLRSRGSLPHTSFPPLDSFRTASLLLDTSVTPGALLALGAIGLLWGLWKQPAVSLCLAGAAFLYTALPLAAFDNRPCIYRTQLFAATIVAVIAGGAPMLLGRLGATWKTAGFALAGLLLVQGLWSRRQFVTQLFDQQEEFAFLEATIPNLPNGVEIVLPAREGADNPFPDFLLERHQIRFRLREVWDGAPPDRWPAPGPNTFFYEGMSCHSSQGAPAPAPLTRVCEAIRDHYELKPVSVRLLDTTGYSAMLYSKPPFEVGFFEATGLKTRSAASHLPAP